jgi:SAM-dependent methyltransferase
MRSSMQCKDPKVQFREAAYGLAREGYSAGRVKALGKSFSAAPFAVADMTLKYALRKILAVAPAWVGRAFGMPAFGKVRFGDLDRTTPIGEVFGGNRGQPVDRYYIEKYLSANADAIRGRVLEVEDNIYTKQFGGSAVTQSDVLHVWPGWPRATIIGDLTVPNTLPKDAFDCLIVTQTLQFIYDIRAALAMMYAALKPGGTLLLTVPGITPVDPGEWGESWYWSFTQPAAQKLVSEQFGSDNVQCVTCGNVFAAIAFLAGVAANELPEGKLDVLDKSFPMIIGVRATKAAA